MPRHNGRPINRGRYAGGGGPELSRRATLDDFADARLAPLVRETGSAAAVAVWLVLFRHADGRTGEVHTTITQLAGLTGLTRKTVGLVVRDLTAARLIAVDGYNRPVRVFLLGRSLKGA